MSYYCHSPRGKGIVLTTFLRHLLKNGRCVFHSFLKKNIQNISISWLCPFPLMTLPSSCNGSSLIFLVTPEKKKERKKKKRNDSNIINFRDFIFLCCTLAFSILNDYVSFFFNFRKLWRLIRFVILYLVLFSSTTHTKLKSTPRLYTDYLPNPNQSHAVLTLSATLTVLTLKFYSCKVYIISSFVTWISATVFIPVSAQVLR